MIVRILGEGQFRVTDEAGKRLEGLDKELDSAVEKGDQAAFTAALDASVAVVRESGAPVADDEIVTADFILPFTDASVEEVRKLLADGMIDSIGLP